MAESDVAAYDIAAADIAAADITAYDVPSDESGGGGGGTPSFDFAIDGLTGLASITRSDGPGDNTGISFSSDGTKMFILGTNGINEINQYNLGTAWDLSTAPASPAATVLLSAPTGETVVRACTMSYDGNYIAQCGVSNDRIRVYQLTAGPWDLSGGVTTVTTAADVTPDRPYHVQFNVDGTALYLLDGINDNIVKFSLSTPYDVSTRSLVARANYPTANVSFAEGGYITPDERYVLISDSGTVKLCEMTTPGDVTTTTWVHTSSTAFPGSGSPRGVWVKNDDGAKIYCGNQDNTVHEADTNI